MDRRRCDAEPAELNAPMSILPVKIAPGLLAEGHCSDAAGQMEIVLAEGDRIIVWADVETSALAFTDDGINNLVEIIKMHKERIMLSRPDDEN